jgi:hypothetical protein
MAGPLETGGPGSEDIVAAAARTSQAAQLTELNALDGKAANLIGFVGVVLSLIYTSSYADRHWTWALTGGTAALAVATLPLGYAVWPRSYRVSPNIEGLIRMFSGAAPAVTYGFIAESIERSILGNQEIIKRKKSAIGAGTVIIVLGVLLVSTSLLYSLNR